MLQLKQSFGINVQWLLNMARCFNMFLIKRRCCHYDRPPAAPIGLCKSQSQLKLFRYGRLQKTIVKLLKCFLSCFAGYGIFVFELWVGLAGQSFQQFLSTSTWIWDRYSQKVSHFLAHWGLPIFFSNIKL